MGCTVLPVPESPGYDSQFPGSLVPRSTWPPARSSQAESPPTMAKFLRTSMFETPISWAQGMGDEKRPTKSSTANTEFPGQNRRRRCSSSCEHCGLRRPVHGHARRRRQSTTAHPSCLMFLVTAQSSSQGRIATDGVQVLADIVDRHAQFVGTFPQAVVAAVPKARSKICMAVGSEFPGTHRRRRCSSSCEHPGPGGSGPRHPQGGRRPPCRQPRSTVYLANGPEFPADDAQVPANIADPGWHPEFPGRLATDFAQVLASIAVRDAQFVGTLKMAHAAGGGKSS